MASQRVIEEGFYIYFLCTFPATWPKCALFFSYFGHSQTSTEVVRGQLQAMQATTLNLNVYMKYYFEGQM